MKMAAKGKDSFSMMCYIMYFLFNDNDSRKRDMYKQTLRKTH
jgi:hypothetical protein